MISAKTSAGPKHRVVASDTAAFLRQALQHRQAAPDLVVVDPPRAGLCRDVTSALGKIRPRKITYVSCDPATLEPRPRRVARIRLSPQKYASAGPFSADLSHLEIRDASCLWTEPIGGDPSRWPPPSPFRKVRSRRHRRKLRPQSFQSFRPSRPQPCSWPSVLPAATRSHSVFGFSPPMLFDCSGSALHRCDDCRLSRRPRSRAPAAILCLLLGFFCAEVQPRPPTTTPLERIAFATPTSTPSIRRLGIETAHVVDGLIIRTTPIRLIESFAPYSNVVRHEQQPANRRAGDRGRRPTSAHRPKAFA